MESSLTPAARVFVFVFACVYLYVYVYARLVDVHCG